MNTLYFEILVQALGLLSFAIFMLAYQIKDPRKTQLIFVPGNIVYGVQYFLLGSTSAGFSLMSSAIRDFTGAVAPKKIVQIISALHLIFIYTISYIFMTSWFEMLVVISGTLSTFATLNRDHFMRFRYLLAGRQISMLIFNIWIQSYAGILHLGFVLISNLIGIYRHQKTERIPS